MTRELFPQQPLDINILRFIYQYGFYIKFNLNDIFYYASADTNNDNGISVGDIRDLTPLIKQYGFWTIVAYEAIVRGHDPEIPKNKENPDFINAKKEILDNLNKYDYNYLFDLRDTIRDPYFEEQVKKGFKE